MTAITPLAMSQTKEDLIATLALPQDVYILMSKEVDRVYKDLTSSKHNLKRNCQRKAPYDWSDIMENAKDEAMRDICRNASGNTSYYWNLAEETFECPNWIARWFLYHKFRYRDGRNRNSVKGSSSAGPHRSSRPAAARNEGARECDMTATIQTDRPCQPSYDYSVAASTTSLSGTYGPYITAVSQVQVYTKAHSRSGTRYDPVRDVTM